MEKIKIIQLREKRNYGILSDVSKTINSTLGDKSGRSVSMRTAHGFKKSFNLNSMHEETAEDIVHVGMVAATALVNNKNQNAKLMGLLLGVGLTICYLNGEE